MNPTSLPPSAERASSLPITAPLTLGQRVWKGFGGTPWWRLVVGALIVLTAVALFTVPFDSIRLSQQLTTPAARQAFRLAVQKQALERARTGMLSFRLFVNDPGVDKDIDRAILEIENAITAERHEVTVGSAAEIKALVDSQREDVKKASRALEMAAAKLRTNTDASENEANVEALSNKAEALQNSVEQLQALQTHAKEFADAEKDARASTAGNSERTKITINLFGRPDPPSNALSPLSPLQIGRAHV